MNLKLKLFFGLFLFLSSCRSSVIKISIPVASESELDMTKFSKIVVFPFVAIASDNDLWKSSEELGSDLVRQLRLKLKRSNFEVVETRDTMQIIGENVLSEEDIKSRDKLVEWGDYLEADLAVVGTYKFRTSSEPRREYTERYSQQLRQYINESHDYLEKTYIFKLRITMVDLANSEVIWSKDYDAHQSEAHTIGSFIVSEVASEMTMMETLGQKSIEQFMRQITPHYNRSERLLVK